MGAKREPQVRSSALGMPLTKRAARRKARDYAAHIIELAICDGVSPEEEPHLWKIINSLRAESGKRHTNALCESARQPKS